MTPSVPLCTDFSNIPELIAQLQENYQYWLEQYHPLPQPTSDEETEYVSYSGDHVSYKCLEGGGGGDHVSYKCLGMVIM